MHSEPQSAGQEMLSPFPDSSRAKIHRGCTDYDTRASVCDNRVQALRELLRIKGRMHFRVVVEINEEIARGGGLVFRDHFCIIRLPALAPEFKSPRPLIESAAAVALV